MPKSVLLVDDDESIRNLYCNILGEAGYRVSMASSGEEAFEKIKETPFQLVISDVYMKGISGLDLLAKIHELNPETKVILMTSHGDFYPGENAFKKGLFWCLSKPLDDLNDLVSKATLAIGPP